MSGRSSESITGNRNGGLSAMPSYMTMLGKISPLHSTIETHWTPEYWMFLVEHSRMSGLSYSGGASLVFFGTYEGRILWRKMSAETPQAKTSFGVVPTDVLGILSGMVLKSSRPKKVFEIAILTSTLSGSESCCGGGWQTMGSAAGHDCDFGKLTTKVTTDQP
ncbi:hypothetical protein BD779DRAFT_1785635 [Infundibulicybe gibba]|nr:hypothetical protein BD779DRAFT_1785635 [Infundibulicybe gibba]